MDHFGNTSVASLATNPVKIRGLYLGMHKHMEI